MHDATVLIRSHLISQSQMGDEARLAKMPLEVDRRFEYRVSRVLPIQTQSISRAGIHDADTPGWMRQARRASCPTSRPKRQFRCETSSLASTGTQQHHHLLVMRHDKDKTPDWAATICQIRVLVEF